MPRPATPVDDLMRILPDTHVSEVYMSIGRLIELGSFAAVATALSALVCMYCAYICLTDREVKMDGRFLLIAFISALCTGIMIALTWAILYTGVPITAAA